MNKPVYVGQTILDESKRIMCEFHYGFMKKQIKPENLNLLFTDTDSLCYHIKEQNIYDLMKKHEADRFDLSNFSKSGDMYSALNEKRVIMMKEEQAKIPIVEVAAPAVKCYSALLADGTTLKKCKGGKKSVVARELTHEHYKECIFGNTEMYAEQNTIRNMGAHSLYSIHQKKRFLNPRDDKVYLCEDGVTTRTHGHYLNNK